MGIHSPGELAFKPPPWGYWGVGRPLVCRVRMRHKMLDQVYEESLVIQRRWAQNQGRVQCRIRGRIVRETNSMELPSGFQELVIPRNP